MTFPRYPAYKDSGVTWLGEVPEHWEVKPLKKLGKLITGLTPPTDDKDNYVDDDGLPWLRPEDIDETGLPSNASKFLSQKGWEFTRRAAENATVICCIGTIGKTGFTDIEIATNQQITAINFHRNSRYFYYAICAAKPVMDCEATGNVIRILNSERLGSIRIFEPPTEDAETIAAFLDRETAKIDDLIAEQRSLTALLKEKRQAVISHAVTKGLNPKAVMKNSGVAWLGEVPGHWEVKKVKYLTTRISSGKTPLGGSEVYVDDGVMFLRSQNIYDEGLRLDDVVYIAEAVDKAMAVSRVNTLDILLNVTGASIGRSCVVPSEFSSANVNQHVCVIRLRTLSQVTFVGWFFKSTPLKNQIDHAQNGAAREGLNFDQIGNMDIALPPIAEQKAISDFLDHQTTQIDTLITETEKTITLLQERRSALISAAVTGKMDVRGGNL